MMQFTTNNKTPYVAEAFVSYDSSVVTVVKATFSFATDGSVKVADGQLPLFYGDDYAGEPGKSSLKYASDMVPEKRGCDIVLIGHAYAPHKKNAKKVRTSLMVGTVAKTMLITGDRFWKWGIFGISKTRPLPFNKMPLVYERAFGGADTSHRKEKRHGYCEENPAGTGYCKVKNRKNIHGLKLPNLELENQVIKKWRNKPTPAGYGFIAPHWAQRVKYSGTYDEKWKQARMPLLPEDFDARFYNAAAPDLVAKECLKGAESVTLLNLHPESEKVRFNLPKISIVTSYIFEHQTYKPPAAVDTLVIEPDENRFTMVWRSRIAGPDMLRDLKQIKVDYE